MEVRFIIRFITIATAGVVLLLSIKMLQRRRAEVLAQMAVKEMEKGDFDRAKLFVERALRLCSSAHLHGIHSLVNAVPAMPRAAVMRHPEFSLDERQRLTEALTANNAGLAVNAEDDSLWHNRAWLRFYLGEGIPRVIEDIERAIAIDGGADLYRISAGLLHDHCGQLENADVAYASALVQSPELTDSPWARALRSSSGHRWNRIVQLAIQNLLHRNREGDEVIEARVARLQMEIGSLGEAEKTFLKITDALPQLPRPWINLGRIYLVTGRLVEAEKCFRKALAVDGNDVLGWIGMANLSALFGDFSQSSAYMDRIADAQNRLLSRHAARARGVYRMNAVLKDDVLPPGLLEFCSPSIKSMDNWTTRRGPIE